MIKKCKITHIINPPIRGIVKKPIREGNIVDLNCGQILACMGVASVDEILESGAEVRLNRDNYKLDNNQATTNITIQDALDPYIGINLDDIAVKSDEVVVTETNTEVSEENKVEESTETTEEVKVEENETTVNTESTEEVPITEVAETAEEVKVEENETTVNTESTEEVAEIKIDDNEATQTTDNVEEKAEENHQSSPTHPNQKKKRK